MANVNEFEMVLVALGAAIMIYVMLNAIGQSAAALADQAIAERRAQAEQELAADAAAEAIGRAAALEPLALNPDGSLAEPIVAIVEDKS